MKNTKAIREVLRKLGIRADMIGFAYLEQAITIWQPGSMICKDLYPTIARNNRTTMTAVERAVRIAIKDSWDWQRGRTDMIFEVFGLWAIRTRPTAAQLIAAVGVYLEEVEADEN